MDWIQALILGLVQGLTEFLPVSSSGHLTIGQEVLGLNTSGSENLLFDIVVHAATVLSTIVILWGEISHVLKGSLKGGLNTWNDDREYVLKICISMIPIFVVGMFFKDFVEDLFGEGLLVVGICLLVTASLLAFSYYAKPRIKEDISRRDAFIIGLGQACAVLPGLSRSGTTIATGLLLGNKKESVAKFSFLMVLVPILGEAFLELLKIIKHKCPDCKTIMEMNSDGEWFCQVCDKVQNMGLDMSVAVVGFLAAFISGALACKGMIEFVKKGKLIYFAIYCAIIGCWAIGYSMM
ncbi:MAG: undecaprenyl-diphosphate phosphatase [Paludibacteraceae bacterium]|nr:undecaprenyl-diphosphate phosphatase [Paludibacteraceae bacterium]